MTNPTTQFVIKAKDETGPGIASAIGGLNTLKGSATSLLQMGVGGMAGGFATALLGAGFMSTIGEAINSLDKMDEAAERIGLTTESLSGLSYAGKMSGVEFEDMTAALSKLSVKMQDAASGGKEASAWFKDVGVSVKGADGNLKSVDVVLAEVADRFRGFEDGAAKTALAVDGLGKSGAKLVPMLNQGASGLKSMHEEASRLGGIIDGKLAKQAAEFNDNLDRLGVLSASAGKSIAGGLLPSLNDLAESFLIAQKHSTGFFDSLGKKIPGLQSVDISSNLKSVRSDLESLEADRARWIKNGNSTTDGSTKIDSMIADKRRELEYYKELQRNEAPKGSEGNYGNKGRGVPSGDAKTTIKRTKVDDGSKSNKFDAKEFHNDEILRLSKQAAKEGEEITKLADETARANASMAQTVDNLTDAYARQNAIFGERSMSVEERELAAALRDVEERADQAREALSAKAATLSGDNVVALEAFRNAVISVSDAEATQAATARANHEERLRQNSDWRTGFTDSLSKYEASSRNVAQTASDAFTGAFGSMESAIVEFTMTGKLAYKDMARSILADLSRIYAKQAVMGLVKTGISLASSYFASSSTASTYGTTAGSEQTTMLASQDAAFKNAKGGVYQSPSLHSYVNEVHSSPKMFAFAKGGALGVFAEAGPEAIMPLSRDASGRLGVKAQGGAGGDVQINVDVNIASDGSTKEDADSNGSGSAKALGQMVANACRQVLVQEMRSGGMLERVRAA